MVVRNSLCVTARLKAKCLKLPLLVLGLRKGGDGGVGVDRGPNLENVVSLSRISYWLACFGGIIACKVSFSTSSPGDLKKKEVFADITGITVKLKLTLSRIKAQENTCTKMFDSHCRRSP